MASPKFAKKKHQIAAKGQEIYDKKLRDKLEPEYRGQIVAIEIDSEDYFLGASVVEAVKKAKKNYPDKLFYFVKVGFPAVHIRRFGVGVTDCSIAPCGRLLDFGYKPLCYTGFVIIVAEPLAGVV